MALTEHTPSGGDDPGSGAGFADEFLTTVKALAKRGSEKCPGLLSVEKFALNRQWPTAGSRVFEHFMRNARFPLCASDQDLAGIAKPARLPECVRP